MENWCILQPCLAIVQGLDKETTMLNSSTTLVQLIETLGVSGVEKLLAAHLLSHEVANQYKDMRAAAQKDYVTLYEVNDGNNKRECVFYVEGARFYAEALELGTVVCTQCDDMTFEQYSETLSTPEKIKVRKTIRLFMDNKELFLSN